VTGGRVDPSGGRRSLKAARPGWRSGLLLALRRAALALSILLLAGTAAVQAAEENRAPVANFEVATASPMANDGVEFRSTGFAFDLDGNATIQYYRWIWGDGTETAGNGSTTYADPTHVFTKSGNYNVTLIVGDGQLYSQPVTKKVRINADHALLVAIRGKLPSGLYADLNHSSIDVRLSLNVAGGISIGLGKNQMSAYPDGGLFTVNAGLWAEGDQVELKLKDTRVAITWMSRIVNLSDQFGTLDVNGDPIVSVTDFAIRMPMLPTITPLPPDANDSTIPGVCTQSWTSDSSPDPIYCRMDAPFHGVGHVDYKDGTPAANAEVEVELRYLAGYLPGNDERPLRDALDNNPNYPRFNNGVLGWCRATVTTTDEDGDFAWVVENPNCLLPDMGVFGFGHWDTHAVVTHPGTTSATSPHKSIYVDPTGILADVWLP
jgi:PKD repeat protein